MPHDMNDPAGIEIQGANKIRRRFFLHSDEYIAGQVQPGTTPPDGYMIKGPFASRKWTVKFKEIAEAASAVVIEACFDLDDVRLQIDVTTPVTPDRTYTDSNPTWEALSSSPVSLAKLGGDSIVIDWDNEGLSKDTMPSAVRFRLTSGKEVRIEIEEGIL